MTAQLRFRQPDDPGPSPGVCPTCGCRCRRDESADAIRLLKRNAGRVDKTLIALALNWPLARLERFARQCKPPFNLTVTRARETDPRGA